MADERDPTERERDPRVSQRYRELGVEEPPRALDEKILAASRRAIPGEMRARPAPLVVPTGRRRWYFPVAAAAVITLAVAVTVQMERQKPEEEFNASAPARVMKEEQVASAPAAAEAPKSAPKPARAPQQFTPEPPPTVQAPRAAPPDSQSADALRDLAKSNEQATSAQGARAPEAPAEARARNDVRREVESPRPQAGVMARGALQSNVETPEAALERIAELRKQGKHEEADKALAEFRQRYPEYRLTDEVRAKVEKK